MQNQNANEGRGASSHRGNSPGIRATHNHLSDVDTWLSHLNRIDPKSPSTLRGYRSAVQQWIRWVDNHVGSLGSVGVAEVHAFQDHLLKNHSRAYAAYIGGRVASFHEWLGGKNPFRDQETIIKVGRIAHQEEYRRRENRFKSGYRAVSNYLADPEASCRLAWPDAGEFTLERDRFLIDMLLGSGLRLGEMIRARIGHLSEDGRFLLVSEAKSTGRQVPTVLIRDALCRWIPVLTARFGNSPGLAIYPTRSGKPFKSQTVPRDRVQRILRILGADADGIGPHTLRHIFHSNLQQMGVPLTVISAITGNTVAVQMSHYAHNAGPENAEHALLTATAEGVRCGTTSR